MSWHEIPRMARSSRAEFSASDFNLEGNRLAFDLLAGIERVDRLVDGARLGLRPSPAGVKVCRYKNRRRVRIVAPVAIRDLDIGIDDMLVFTGMEDGIFVFEKETR